MELLDVLHLKTTWQFALQQKFFYEHANKSGRLAKMIASKKNAMRIDTVTDHSGQKLSRSDQIAQAFRSYFSDL